jgi:hypothetical protein
MTLRKAKLKPKRERKKDPEGQELKQEQGPNEGEMRDEELN